MRLDKIILTNFYLTRGFLNVWVETEVNRQGEKIEVVFVISEGRRFILQELTFCRGGIRFLKTRLAEILQK